MLIYLRPNISITFKRLSFTVFFLLTQIFSWGQVSSSAQKKVTNSKIDSLLLDAVKSVESADYPKAFKTLFTVKDLAKSINNTQRIGHTCYSLALLYFQSKDYGNALTELSTTISLQQKDLDYQNLGKSYLLGSQINLKIPRLDSASAFLNKASALIEKHNLLEIKPKLNLLKGNNEMVNKEVNKAIRFYELAFKDTAEKDNYLIAEISLQQAKAYIANKNYEQASKVLKRSVAISKKNNYAVLNRESFQLSSELAGQNKNYEQAYKDLKKYLAGKSAISDIENSSATLLINNISQTALTEAINKGVKEQSLKVTTITAILIIGLTTLLALLIFSLYKNNNLRAKANELLQNKNNELVVAKENAEKASMVKAQFLSTITHELRTPMYAVTGLTHLLLSENPTPEQKKHLDSLKFSGEYLLSLINNILDLNKLEANKVELEETSFNLRKRVEDVLFALEKSAKDKGNKLHLEFDEDIPPELLGDPLAISQILINLVGNAVKFTRDGQVFVRVQKISQSKSDIGLHLEVEDTGEGISKKKQKNIFQNFTQGSVAINRKFGGTGLGLSIVKNLLDLMDSEIDLESTLGKGSVFKFDIKYNLAKSLTENENPHNIIYDVDYVALENRNILVVEDNKINQMITKKILEKNKIICDVADNGEIAVEKARTSSFDLILMDIHMPGISGIEATEKIRTFNMEIPIIALTAVTIDDNIDDFFVAGFNDIIPKPYKVEEFFQKIHNALKKTKVLNS